MIHFPGVETCSRKENVIAFISGFLTCHLVTLNAVYCGPGPDAVLGIGQFIEFGLCRHTPVPAPDYVSCIILRINQDLIQSLVFLEGYLILVFGGSDGFNIEV